LSSGIRADPGPGQVKGVHGPVAVEVRRGAGAALPERAEEDHQVGGIDGTVMVQVADARRHGRLERATIDHRCRTDAGAGAGSHPAVLTGAEFLGEHAVSNDEVGEFVVGVDRPALSVTLGNPRRTLPLVPD